ncbi:ABC transporter ATP-binding protein [Paremcibacter congregatus]|uniref:Multidrug ABC transporter ATP-binding protein n=1 Tax=Paremcibacter congregatus TaxID=2043170 RepID=A0A2G4YT86_9PROT|nr:ABC transporter ATP-binding protein [Paremcibacter congregatus]PHZ85541.1 multidrug ABC transporter ATP-binding protein [Paremcibacter congregatus]QDE26501.1 ABC transporter ATP-binding protein [Paremcibacter congregatus]
MTNIITAQNLSKSYGNFKALKNVDLNIEKGQIVGIIGANGAGKTTLLNSILGLSAYDGDLKVLGFDPYSQRDELMKEICFISDVATLPKWIKVHEAIDFVEGVHPSFDREKALAFLKETSVPLDKKVRQLSKGMIVQVHLALIMSIDAKILVLDEPTLGLDIIYRKKFYHHLLEDFFDEDRTILITTHQVDEIENILSQVVFIREGQIVLAADMEDIGENWMVLNPPAANVDAARALGPVSEQSVLGRTSFIFKGRSRAELSELGDVNRINLSDLFVTLMEGR